MPSSDAVVWGERSDEGAGLFRLRELVGCVGALRVGLDERRTDCHVAMKMNENQMLSISIVSSDGIPYM